MKLSQLIMALQRIEKKHNGDLEVEMCDMDMTYTVESVKFVEDYSFPNASCLRPSVLLYCEE